MLCRHRRTSWARGRSRSRTPSRDRCEGRSRSLAASAAQAQEASNQPNVTLMPATATCCENDTFTCTAYTVVLSSLPVVMYRLFRLGLRGTNESSKISSPGSHPDFSTSAADRSSWRMTSAASASYSFMSTLCLLRSFCCSALAAAVDDAVRRTSRFLRLLLAATPKMLASSAFSATSDALKGDMLHNVTAGNRCRIENDDDIATITYA